MMVVSSLPWAALLPTTFIQAWKNKRQPVFAFLLLWLLLPLAVFSMSSGKLPTYIMPCLLPLALLMGHAVTELLAHARGRTIRINGWLNVVIATGALLALLYLQATREIYANTEMFSLSMVYIVLVGWIIANALQILRPWSFGRCRHLASGCWSRCCRRHAEPDCRQQNARPVYRRAPGQPEADHVIAQQ
jgi:4-amino-4-deoxy-L-arabinose transferase